MSDVDIFRDTLCALGSPTDAKSLDKFMTELKFNARVCFDKPNAVIKAITDIMEASMSQNDFAKYHHYNQEKQRRNELLLANRDNREAKRSK